jgi:FMN-dependent NADH-azoreductase
MKKVLYINGNPQQETYSYSRRVANYYLEQRNRASEGVQVEVVNVYEDDIPLIDQDVLAAWGQLQSGEAFSDLSEDQQAKAGRMGQVLEQFKAADEILVATPLWNFSVPPMLKAYIDNIAIAGETFKYTEEGPVGLMGDKKLTVIQASGGVYSSGPAAAMDHASNYLKHVFGFIGVEDVKVVYVEGIAIPGKSEEDRLQDAFKDVDDLFEPEFV